ncbi:MAG TPA: ABC transporter permease [Vicinamibacterales bacterium]|nr:ABC transporter permease [Vicinamibacterales bacterium]
MPFLRAIHSFTRAPAHTALVVAMLGVGIGATTAVFSVVDAVVLRPLHAPSADRLVRSVTVDHGTWLEVSDGETLKVWREHPELFEDVSAYRLEFLNLTGLPSPHQLATARVSDRFFPLFGASFVAGRPFTADEDRPGGPAVAVLSDALWESTFGGDPNVVGRTITLGNVPHVIVGVLASGFQTEQFDATPDIWTPLQADPDRVTGASIYQVAARLQPTVTSTEADAVLRVAYARFQASRGGRTDPAAASWIAAPLQAAMVRDVRSSLDLLLGAVAFLLALACVNVTNLLLLRGESRQREVAIRAALGAGRGRLVRELVAESATLACLGGVVGVLAGPPAMRALLALYPTSNPFILGRVGATIPRLGAAAASVHVDLRVLGFAAVVSVLVGIVCGVVPALRVTARGMNLILQRTSLAVASSRGFFRRFLVVVEVALALVLVIGATLFARSSLALGAIDPGFASDHVLTLRMSIGDTAFASQDGITRLQRDGLAAIARVPGVTSAGLTCCLPLETVWQLPFVMQSRAGEGLHVSGRLRFHGFAGWTFVTPGYFTVLRVPVLRGRDFSDEDDATGPPVAIINETMARRFWPHGDPLSDRLTLGRGMHPAYDAEPTRQIVGIVRDVRDTNLAQPPRPAVYVPAAQLPGAVTAMDTQLLPMAWVVRTAGDPRTVAAGVRTALEDATHLPVARMRTMDEVVAESIARPRFHAWVMTIFGLTALAIAAFGVYALISFWVQQRSREIGVRLALGAAPARIACDIVMQAARLAVAGVLIGSVAALAGGRAVAGLLFGVRTYDPLVFIAAPVLLLLVGLAAAATPARRAAAVDPVVSLRAE